MSKGYHAARHSAKTGDFKYFYPMDFFDPGIWKRVKY